MMRAEEFAEEYYDVDDIVAVYSRITCQLSRETPKEILELFAANLPDWMRESGLKVDVPFFMTLSIKAFCINVIMPKPFNDHMQQILRAGAGEVDLERLHPHYYRFGKHLALFFGGRIGLNLAKALLDAFVQRIGNHLTKAVNSDELGGKMDPYEKKIFDVGKQTKGLMNAWTQSSSKRKRPHGPDL